MHTSNGHNGKLTLKSLQSEMTNRLAGLEDNLQQATSHPNFNGKDTPRLKFVLAIIAGCTTPLICLAMSTLGGHLASHGTGHVKWLALLPFAVLLAMLIVSTPHIAEAKRELHWENWQAWSFAIGLDFAITVSELITVWGSEAVADVRWLPHIVIGGAVIYSAALNSYVNLLHAGWSGVQDHRSN
ncbi:Hypothetical protein PBC10988_3030 [Planctomycetales bacterium 10988]|nr:Hypothetical protein PBC10988_3030 [Planctomycetales bacterium 10988]